MKKLFTGIFAATLLTAGAGVALEHGYVKAEEPSKASEDAAGDAWEKAAKEAETPKVETPKAETPKQPVIDEEYVKKNIDTPTGKEEKAKEDAYKDKAEAKYKEELKKQEANKKAPAKALAKAPVKRALPKTSAVR